MHDMYRKGTSERTQLSPVQVSHWSLVHQPGSQFLSRAEGDVVLWLLGYNWYTDFFTADFALKNNTLVDLNSGSITPLLFLPIKPSLLLFSSSDGRLIRTTAKRWNKHHLMTAGPGCWMSWIWPFLIFSWVRVPFHSFALNSFRFLWLEEFGRD